MAPEVTCPRCQHRQPLSSPDGYRCTSCGTRWVFVTCRSCHGRFHMAPDTLSWVCPTCGARNGPAAPAPAAPGGAGIKRTPSRRPSLPFGGERLPLIAIAVATVLVLVLVSVLLGHNKGGTGPSTGSSPSASLTVAQGIAKLCGDIPIDLNLRIDALNRTAGLVRADAQSIKHAGDPATARKAVAVAVAMESYATTLASHGDTTAETAALGAAIDAVKPSCRAA